MAIVNDRQHVKEEAVDATGLVKSNTSVAASMVDFAGKPSRQSRVAS